MLWHLSPHPVLTLEPAALPSPPLIPPGSSCAVSLRAAGALGRPLERCMKALVAPALLPSIGQRDCDAFTCLSRAILTRTSCPRPSAPLSWLPVCGSQGFQGQTATPVLLFQSGGHPGVDMSSLCSGPSLFLRIPVFPMMPPGRARTESQTSGQGTGKTHR